MSEGEWGMSTYSNTSTCNIVSPAQLRTLAHANALACKCVSHAGASTSTHKITQV